MADPVPVASPIAPTPVPVWTQPVIAILVLLIYAGVLVAVFFLQNDTLRVAIYGSAPLVVNQVINYFFGSSSGSAKKSDTIAADSAAKSVALANSTPVSVPPGSATEAPSDAAKALDDKLAAHA